MTHSSKNALRQPDWWTAVFSGIVAITAIGALWFASVQIKDNRQAVEQQLEQSHKEDQIQHLLAMVSEFDQEPMATYRRELAKKRLAGKPGDPLEMYRELDFFETVGLLINRGYLNDKDVWDQFRWWIFNLNADPAVQKGLEFEQHDPQHGDPNQYLDFVSMVGRLKQIDQEQHGKDANPAWPGVMDFYREESEIVSGGK